MDLIILFLKEKFYLEFLKLNQSNDLKSYCKKYNFHMDNIKLFLFKYENYLSLLDDINKKYIEKKLVEEKEYFDYVFEECSPNIRLDEEQRIAILTDEGYNLVIAGVGTGKRQR